MARLGIEPKSVDLIIGPSKRRPEDDIAMRKAFAADRARPDSGKDAARVMAMLERRRRAQKAKRSKKRAA